MPNSLIQQPLAIVGMACRLPGGDSLDDYWQLLAQGRSAVSPLTSRVLDRSLHFDSRKGLRGKTYTAIGGMIADRPADLKKLGIDSKFAESWDECHLTFAETAATAWQHAGYSRSPSPSNVGVYIGHSGGSRTAGDLVYSSLAESTAELLDDIPDFKKLPASQRRLIIQAMAKRMKAGKIQRRPEGKPYLEASAAARLVSHVLNFSGPQMVLDAACASSLVALGLAAVDLQSGKIDAALVGGASYNKVDSLILFSQAQSCSATASRPFDERADGLIASEGYIALVIKTLDKALENNDHIWGVLRGLGIATDGRGKSLWAPRREGQFAAMQRAYEADVDPKRVQFVEAHATSTQVGDATEAQALADFYGPYHQVGSLPIGSVKSNIGHTLETAGLAGLLKTVLAMHHETIPPTIHLEKPSSSIDWKAVPFNVPVQAVSWPLPSDGAPRCGAVNAFGIGGLNVHVVVEQFDVVYHRRIAGSPARKANHAHSNSLEPIAVVGMGIIAPGAQSVEQLQQLLASGESKIIPPPEARRRKSTASVAPPYKEIQPTSLRGGYLVDYHYDWKKHKIPPKQVQLANPLQFMLLDAADQTWHKALDQRSSEPQPRTTVVVGTIFGGEFGHQLQLGLRLSELRSDLNVVLSEGSVDNHTSEQIAEDFIDRVLEANPALLDETGSFTSSTLASRITKQFNLMGGAMAIDAGDASSEAALSAACGLLRTGTSDAVVCAAGQRAMDLPSYQAWASRNEIADQHENVRLPGEGTVVLLLKRLSDAQRQGEKILGVISGVEVVQQRLPFQNASRIEKQVGDLKSTRILLDMAAVLATDKDASPKSYAFASRYADGTNYRVEFCNGESPTVNHQTATIQSWPPKQVESIATSATKNSEKTERSFSRRDGMLTAVFPGQGSQSPGMLDRILSQSASAQATLNEANRVLRALGTSEFDDLCRLSASKNAAESIWPIQGSMLIADLVYGAAWLEKYPVPDVVLGHSLGEPAAMVFAEAWTLEEAIKFVHRRAAVVARNGDLESGLLSVLAPLEEVETVLRNFALPIQITHDNSPRQTVVGGRRSDLSEFQKHIASKRWSSLMLNVPVAFHTNLLSTAQLALVDAARKLELRPPRIPIFSTVTGRLTSDPDELRRNLIDQLTRPVLYRMNVQKLYEWGCRMFVEVGPGNVLTKLNQAILGGSTAISMAMDSDEASSSLVEKIRQATSEQPIIAGNHRPLESDSNIASLGKPRSLQPIVAVDATEARRQRRRTQATQNASLSESRLPSPTFSEDIHLTTELLPSPVLPGEGPGVRASSDLSESPGETSSCIDGAALEAFVRDFIVEHTGYPPEMIELDWDLEADLGIDSIKLAQLFGELRELFEIEPSRLASGRVRTIRQIVELLAGSGGKGEWLKDPSNDVTSLDSVDQPSSKPASNFQRQSVSINTEAALADQNVPAVKQSSSSRETIAEFMIDFVIEHTGYPREIIDMHADFEADLGLDSIKLAQLFGELRTNFDLSTSGDRSVLAKCRTLNDILELFPSDAIDLPKNNEPGNDLSPAQRTVNHLNAVEKEDHVRPGFEAGLAWGKANASSVQSRLVESVDRFDKPVTGTAVATPIAELKSDEWWRGVAEGSSIDEACILAAVAELHSLVLETEKQVFNFDDQPVPIELPKDSITHRYELTMADAPFDASASASPTWKGSAFIVGCNPVADALAQSMQKEQVRVVQLDSRTSIDELKSALDAAWEIEPVLHLFLAMPHDSEAAVSLSAEAWSHRREAGMTQAFWLCQHWIKLVIEAEKIQQATLVALTRLGGDFGFSGSIQAPESGTLTGLLKAVVIENWVNGHRGLAVKIVDAARLDGPESIVRAVRCELANSSYDMEISWSLGKRRVVRAFPISITPTKKPTVTRGGNWIFTGGGRGITAFVAEELALRYDLRLHLIGTAPVPDVPDAWRGLDEAGTRELKLAIMQSARLDTRPNAVNPIKAWQNVEKAIEIDATLERMRSKGIRVEYYGCDCSDAKSLKSVLEQIRRNFGPIHGCLHGAGVGQDARFDRKRPDKVEQCLSAKVDGAIALMDATAGDPLEFFIGFGSISGRFGANGHSDYSMANDGMAKCIDWYRAKRPEVRAVCFHWHAWGDIGMATKPETKLALEMIDMQFMPAREGLAHLIREIEGGAPRGEVLITDDRYYRMFYPAETVQASDVEQTDHAFAILDSEMNSAILDPVHDVFLREHCLDGNPLLPMVVGLELLVEAASHKRNLKPLQFGGPKLYVRNFESVQGLRFFTTDPKQIDLVSDGDIASDSQSGFSTIEGSLSRFELRADFKARNGKLIEAQRCYMLADVAETNHAALFDWQPFQPEGLAWTEAKYPPPDATFFVGPAFRVLKQVALKNERAFGIIQAPSLIELAGNKRKVVGWRTPSAILDACLFATGVLAWNYIRPGINLPVGFRELLFHRMPKPGESCRLETRCVRFDDRTAEFDFCLWGSDGKLAIEAAGYFTAWLELGAS
jgi:acyl transferase domain-containing protein/acyl carrier protein/NAD(P)-dependent dehydrogenase (short-subunit alcohol dehydrogenase family)